MAGTGRHGGGWESDGQVGGHGRDSGSFPPRACCGENGGIRGWTLTMARWGCCRGQAARQRLCGWGERGAVLGSQEGAEAELWGCPGGKDPAQLLRVVGGALGGACRPDFPGQQGAGRELVLRPCTRCEHSCSLLTSGGRGPERLGLGPGSLWAAPALPWTCYFPMALHYSLACPAAHTWPPPCPFESPCPGESRSDPTPGRW